jgi:hypothetical protein
MKNNFDLKKFLLENKLTAPSEMHEVTSEKVQEVYDEIIESFREKVKALNYDEVHELHEKFKEFFNSGI